MPDLIDADELTDLGQAIRRVARSRGADLSTADDVAQETLTRLLSAADRLDPSARLPWALTTAGNLLVSMHRDVDMARRHRHRLVDRAPGTHPELDLIALEQANAVRAALGELGHDDRQLLLDHLDGASTIDLASASESTVGAVAARLHRTRARMRLDYLLALRRVELPTPACRRVLLAVSAADQRRQQALDAARHFATCATCADMVAPLARRSSRLAGIAAAPLVMLGAWGGRIVRISCSNVVQASASAAAVGVAAGVYVLTPDTSKPKPVAAPVPVAAQVVRQSAVHTDSGVPLLPVPASATLTGLAGQQVIATRVTVQSVVSYPGFWVGSGSQRLYVHIGRPQLIKAQIKIGQMVTFTGVLTQNVSGFAASDGVSARGDAVLLTRQGFHLTVDALALHRPDALARRERDEVAQATAG